MAITFSASCIDARTSSYSTVDTGMLGDHGVTVKAQQCLGCMHPFHATGCALCALGHAVVQLQANADQQVQQLREEIAQRTDPRLYG